jgi:hypothetical protein
MSMASYTLLDGHTGGDNFRHRYPYTRTFTSQTERDLAFERLRGWDGVSCLPAE